MAQLCTCFKMGLGFLQIWADIAELCKKKTQNHLFFADILTINSGRQVKASSFRIKVNFGVDCLRHKKTIGVSFIAQFVTHLHMFKKRFPYVKQVVPKTHGIIRCRAQFCEFRSEKSTQYLWSTYIQYSWMPALLVLSFPQDFLSLFFSLRIDNSVIFLGQKKKRRRKMCRDWIYLLWHGQRRVRISCPKFVKLRAASAISGCCREAWLTHSSYPIYLHPAWIASFYLQAHLGVCWP